ncbi:TerD family protein [Selenomonas sp.]|uniref:TerD family protein n=1 Tax=Selenomonas sp. TaxID=2053611 RepID=UPI0025E9D5D6|nr:TerD family protein [Selenomonas sp.]MCI6086359.1 TerD domain-containing protein [Selenomonas sp.]MDY3298336.1 TerD family protein [Selenomonas sp.]MDY4414868.1 TerD family protein [Selenomonas sp.]
MGMALRKGGKADLTKTRPGLRHLVIGLGWRAPQGYDIDAAAFLLGADGKAAGDSDFIFYGNPRHITGSVEAATNPAGGDAAQVLIDLPAVPAATERIAFTATIYDPETRRQQFGQVQGIYLRVSDEDTGEELARYDVDGGLQGETAIVVGEVYRYKGNWKFNAIGNGYRGGLEALCKSFGLTVSGSQGGGRPAPAPKPQPAPPRPTPAPQPAPQPKKVELRKGQKVSLVKRQGAKLGEIVINLNWHQGSGQSSGGFLSSIFGGGGSGAIDLDLGCLFELKDGRKGAVQALGNAFGSLDAPPYIALDGDDRTGASAGGETLRVNGRQASEIRRILVYTFIYEGVANWQQADGVVTVKCPGSPDIIVRMDEYGSSDRMCAIALLENVGGDNFSVEKIVRFFGGHEKMDAAFHWGLRWVAGSKD